MSDQASEPAAQPQAPVLQGIVATIGPKLQNTALATGGGAVVTDTLQWVIDGVTAGWKPPSHDLVSGWAVALVFIAHWVQKKYFPGVAS